MDYRPAIQRVISYIEDNIGQKVSLKQLSSQAAMSPYHFSRLFTIYTGLPPLTYTRRRKMFHAARRIINGEKILGVALDLGYSSHSAFSRVFKSALGSSPTSWTKQISYTLSKPISLQTKKLENKGGVSASFETESLQIRTFQPEDWSAIQELAVDRSNAPTSHYDHPWPTSDKDCKNIARYFSQSDEFWAVCKKDSCTIIGIIVLNGIEEDGALDFGHLFRSDHMNREIMTEAIQRMVQYVFDEREVQSIVTHNAAAWADQIEPLMSLGFKKIGEGTASFAKDARGTPMEFLAYTLELTQANWERYSSQRQQNQSV